MSLLLSNFYPRADAVLVTGNQSITGVKTFNERINATEIRGIGIGGSLKKIDPNLGHLYSSTAISLDYFQRILSGQWRLNQIPTINGTGILLSGDANVVFTNGAQIINGQKTFNERVATPEIRGTGTLAASRKIDLEQGQLYAGTSFVSLDYFRRSLSGSWAFDNRPTVNGTGVLLNGDYLDQNFVPNLYLRTSAKDNNNNDNGGIVSAISEDGLKWTSLSRNINFPTFARDASTIWYNNQWVSVYTNAFTSNSKSFGLATSTNLTSWNLNAPIILTGSATAGTANNVWAPEWFVDNNEYYVIVRLSTTAGNNYGTPGMGYIRSLNPGTWTLWSAWTPFDNSVRIDANDFYIVKKDNLYWLFSHGGTHLNGQQPLGLSIVNNITLQYSTNPFTGYSSLVQITEPFRNIIRPGNSSAFFEGPSVVNIEGSHWRLYFQDGLDNSLWSIDSFDGFQSWPTGTLRKNLYEGFDGGGHGTVLKINERNFAGITTSLRNINSPLSIGAVDLISDQNISGLKNFRVRPTVNGSGVLLQGETLSTSLENIVFTTGAQTITAPKNFTARPTLSGVPLITTGDLVNLELNIEGALSASTNFNGNREIKAVPVINTNYGGTTISGFLENMFFPYRNSTIVLNQPTILTYGINSFNSFPFAGSVEKRDDTITGIAYRSGNLILSGPTTRPDSDGTFSTVPIPLSTTFRESSPEILNAQLFVTKNGQQETRISNNVRLRFEPRYYYGVSSNPNLGTDISQLTAPPVNTYTHPFGSRPASVTHTGFSPNAQYIYFAYPSPNTTQDNIINWGNTLSSIFDTNANFEYIGQYTQLTPVTINFLWKSLQYRIYRSNDLITLAPNQSLTLRFTFGA